MNIDVRTSWEIPTLEVTDIGGNGRSQADCDKRLVLVEKVVEIGIKNRWTKREVAKRSGVAEGSFSQWFSAKYKGRFDEINQKVDNWIVGLTGAMAIKQAIPKSPKFIETKIAVEIWGTFAAAQNLPAMTLITADAGAGKTATSREYKLRNANVYIVVISPHTKTVHSMLLSTAEAVGVKHANPARLVSDIGKRLKSENAPTLLIVDEAQNLVDDAINQLRHFTDEYGCGIALLGNNESYTRFAAWGKSAQYGQLHRRIFKRVSQKKPNKSDIEMFIRAWGIEEPEMVRFLTGVGMKPGALGQIDMTIKLAMLKAVGEGKELTLEALQKAWKNRDVEG